MCLCVRVCVCACVCARVCMYGFVDRSSFLSPYKVRLCVVHKAAVQPLKRRQGFKGLKQLILS
uniref:Secreted protein n=1 Tax=Anguilla anguilla TaxID=7936 RepID=A0A0E9X5F2_ANGAN